MESINTTQRIIRHSPPGPLDQLPKGTLCEVRLEHHKIEVYEQQGDDSTPKWELITWTSES